MALTKQDLIDMIANDIDEIVVLSDIRAINNAGRELLNMFGWSWQNREIVKLGFTASQAYIDLPADLMRIEEIQPVDESQLFTFVGKEEFLEQQRRQTTPDGYIANQGAGIDVATGILTPRIFIYPTPSTTVIDTLLLSYRAGWNEITSGHATTYRIAIPAYVESLYLEVFRAYYMGLEEVGNAGISQRIAQVKSGTIYADAVAADVNTRPSLSPYPGRHRLYDVEHISTDFP